MASGDPARPSTWRNSGIFLAGLLIGIAGIMTVLGCQSPAPSSPTPASIAARPADVPRLDHRDALGKAGGAVPAGTTAFDDEIPGVAKLDPALLGALRRATAHAADVGVEILVESGWRSPAFQERLFQEAVSKYGSEQEAARWVATPDASAHVSGDAVDIGPAEAIAWLSRHGDDDGLCQIYRNEPWHFELRPDATDHGCPRMYADATHDPRMRR